MYPQMENQLFIQNTATVKNQSLLFDIWMVDIETKKKTLLTSSMRANYPKFSPDLVRSILYVAHEKIYFSIISYGFKRRKYRTNNI